jgi:hypothetical protein
MEERQEDLMARRRVLGLGYLTNSKREAAIMALKRGLEAANRLSSIETNPAKQGLIAIIIDAIKTALIELYEMPAEAGREREVKETNKKR